MADPFVATGALQVRATCAFPGVPTRSVGSPEIDRGIAAAAALANKLVPAAFTAATLNVYDVPLVRPVTVCEVTVDAELRANEVHVPPRHD